jgi:dinuclear metal center YbgI/SA1388 family protein
VWKFKDYGPMGLQFLGGDSAREVTAVAAAVSITENVIEKTAEYGANLLLVHHGLFWNHSSRDMERAPLVTRMQKLRDCGIAVLGYHLALDAHPVMGNNIHAVKAMGVTDPIRFADIGFGGTIIPASVEEVFERIEEVYPSNPIFFAAGPTIITRVAAITGSGGKYLEQAAQEGYDLFLSGEAEEPSRALALELGIHFVAPGHYQTEKSGIDMLGKYLATYAQVPYRFILEDNPV